MAGSFMLERDQKLLLSAKATARSIGHSSLVIGHLLFAFRE